MLSALVVVKTKRQYLAVASGGDFTGTVCLVVKLHPAASGRVYAAYGGVYVCTALMWLRVVDGVKLSLYDWTGALIALCGMLIIVAGWGRT
ncbi:inner membrane protein [Escherichia coli UMEA 3108-1]|nr:inner membrane protein [Escherichia coli UMEA 3108-1]